jgi:hypothetical protein
MCFIVKTKEKKMKWFSVNRGKGQSVKSWNNVHPNEYVQDWINTKKQNGTWVSKDQYEMITGKPGRKD